MGYSVTLSGQYAGVNLGENRYGNSTPFPSEQDLSSPPSGKRSPLQIPQELKFHPVVTTKVDRPSISTPSPTSKVRKNSSAKWRDDESRVKSQTRRIVRDDDGQPFDPRAFRDIIITIKKGEEGSPDEESHASLMAMVGASAK